MPESEVSAELRAVRRMKSGRHFHSINGYHPPKGHLKFCRTGRKCFA